jgi:anti-sigma factor ChrR (cupin superfamily)
MVKLNTDQSQRVVVNASELPWVESPAPGVQRRMLERDGGELARATSIVRYAPQSRFDAHCHGLGEEFLVLEGIFSDETGDFGPGMYVRNPPGSSHSPYSVAGCTIFVKLRQFDPQDDQFVRVDTRRESWQAFERPGLETLPLFSRSHERVLMLRLAPGVRLSCHDHPNGEEIYVVEGDLQDEYGHYPAGTWLRQPPGSRHAPGSVSGCTLYLKAGHLGEV